MRATGLWLLVTSLSLLGCERAGPSPTRWQQLRDGLAYALVHTRGSENRALVTVHALRFDPRRWQQRVVGAPEVGSELADAQAFRRSLGAVAAINAGYFDPKGRPLGLLVSGGIQRSPLRRVDHGVLTVDRDGRPRLQHARAYQPPLHPDFAIECGPRLIVDGSPLTFKAGVARRTALGFDRAGRMHWVVTTGVISLADFAVFLTRPTTSGGLGLSGALNLDGGSSSMLDLKVDQTVVAVRSSVQVPVGLALLPRPSGAARQ